MFDVLSIFTTALESLGLSGYSNILAAVQYTCFGISLGFLMPYIYMKWSSEYEKKQLVSSETAKLKVKPEKVVSCKSINDVADSK